MHDEDYQNTIIPKEFAVVDYVTDRESLVVRIAARDMRIEPAEQFSNDDDSGSLAGTDKLDRTSSAAKFVWMLTVLGFSDFGIAAQAIVEFSKIDDADWARAGLGYAQVYTSGNRRGLSPRLVGVGFDRLTDSLARCARHRRARRKAAAAAQVAGEVERIGLRLRLRKQPAAAGDIVLLYGNESEALTHPYLARVWAKAGADLRVPAPGQARKVAMLGSLDHVTRQLIVHTSPTGAAVTSSPISSNSTGCMVPDPAKPPNRWYSSRTTAQPIPANSRSQRWPSAPTGSPSSGCPSMRRNSTTSRWSGTTSRRTIWRIRPLPTLTRPTAQSITPPSMN